MTRLARLLRRLADRLDPPQPGPDFSLGHAMQRLGDAIKRMREEGL